MRHGKRSTLWSPVNDVKKRGQDVNKGKVFKPFYIARDEIAHRLTIKCHHAECSNESICSCPTINKLHSAKLLGLWFDSNLKWSTHLAICNRSGRNFLRVLYYLREVCPESVLIMLYHSLFVSRITYGIAVWGGTFVSHLNCLVVTQKLVLRCIAKKPRDFPSLPLFQAFNVLPLRQLYMYKTLRLYFSRCGDLPSRCPVDMNMRRRDQFLVPSPRTQLFTKSPNYLIPKLFNMLPFFLTDLKLSAFCKKTLAWIKSLDEVEQYFR